ncbi:hypothetical protein COK_1268 [Mannheimia haemolytica serotype A2 str. BOVINE]|nr:hypothetical protein COK_1268 [Mannheimia haemolytica serotype A2 str. BOVINE]
MRLDLFFLFSVLWVFSLSDGENTKRDRARISKEKKENRTAFLWLFDLNLSV